MHDERVALEDWTARCAQRISELDQDISAAEARRIALDMRQVERLSAMQPEAAVEFVRLQQASDRPDRYERRKAAR